MTPQPITILGYTGGKAHGPGDQIADNARAELHRQHHGATADELRKAWPDIFQRHIFAAVCAEYHNGILPLWLAHAAAAARRAAAALVASEEAYQDLSRRTTTAWHAAHHRYIIAITEAHAALEDHLAAHAALFAYHERNAAGIVNNFYNQLVNPDQQIKMPADTGECIKVQDDFQRTTTARLAVLNYTLNGGYPPGFEPVTETATETAGAR